MEQMNNVPKVEKIKTVEIEQELKNIQDEEDDKIVEMVMNKILNKK